MLIKVSEASGPVLDWMVCFAAGWTPTIRSKVECDNELTGPIFLGDDEQRPSSNWNLAGPLIEREEIDLTKLCPGIWRATNVNHWFNGPTPLIAAMRCYVASKLGDECEVPDELH